MKPALVINGAAGRMGKRIVALAYEGKKFDIVGAADYAEHPDIGKDWVITPPWKLSATPSSIHRHAPILGEHNHEIFHGMLGLSEEEIKALEEEQVIY